MHEYPLFDHVGGLGALSKPPVGPKNVQINIVCVISILLGGVVKKFS